MNVIDSSVWLEYFTDGKNVRNFLAVILDQKNVIVPSIALYEVFKKIFLLEGLEQALKAVASMKRGKIVDLDLELAVSAGKLSTEYKLPMADSIILATAQKHKAILWTQDADFKGIPGVKYFAKKR